jgi:hypothetical protein
MQEPDIPPLFQTISKEESPLSFFGDEVPAEAISDKRDYRNLEGGVGCVKVTGSGKSKGDS